MSWDYLFVQAANGAVIGVIYALIAVGVTLIFSILKIVNFAHGDLYMLGGYCAYYVIEYLGFPPLAAIVGLQERLNRLRGSYFYIPAVDFLMLSLI